MSDHTKFKDEPKKPKAYFYASDRGPRVPYGEYTFAVQKITDNKDDPKFNTFKTSAAGASYASVSLRCEWNGHNAYENATFFFNPRGLPRLADFVEACTGTRPTLAAIETKQGFRSQIEKCVGRWLKATVQLGKPNKNGKAFNEIVDFKPDIAPVPETQARSTSAQPQAPAPTPDDVPF